MARDELTVDGCRAEERVAIRGSALGRTAMALAVLGLVFGGSLSGCAITEPDDSQTVEAVDFGSVAETVKATLPEIVDVRGLARSRNGFGYRLKLSVILDSAAPLSAEDVDQLVESIWHSLPWEPNSIVITASSSDGSQVDLRSAARELEDLGVTDAGQAGVTLTDMDARYGAWSEQ